jgi:hypothetical protein
MPNHKAGTSKQNNKPYKGGQKHKNESKALGVFSEEIFSFLDHHSKENTQN